MSATQEDLTENPLVRAVMGDSFLETFKAAMSLIEIAEEELERAGVPRTQRGALTACQPPADLHGRPRAYRAWVRRLIASW